MAKLKEHGILFSSPMVKAILAGTKTQTRRGVRGATGAFWDHAAYRPVLSDDGRGVVGWECDGVMHPYSLAKAPHGPVGRRLYAKETYGLRSHTDVTSWFRGSIKGWKDAEPWAVDYRADWGSNQEDCFWRPSIHMPRWASRITLEVTRVRVERVGDISEEDATAEGVNPRDAFIVFEGVDAERVRRRPDMERTHRGAFACLWDEINGAGSFASNPWVWVYDFRRVG